MIGAQQVIDSALAEAARLGRADETIVLVTDRADASLRWAGNSMTTNGESTSRHTTVISILRQGNEARVGSVRSSEVDPGVITGLVAASQEAAASAPAARDSAEPLPAGPAPRDWDDPVPGTGAQAFLPLAGSLAARGFRGPDQLYGYARHVMETTFVATSNGLRRRYTQPTGSVEINAKRDGASAWVGVSTPDFADVPTDSMFEQLSTRLGWARRSVELPAGRYETILPPSTVADLMIYLTWTMDGRGAQEGRTALSAPGGGTRVGEKLTDLPLTLYSDPYAAGLECTPFVATTTSSERVSVFDNGMDIGRVDWIRDGAIETLAYPRAAAAEFGAPVAVPADNLVMTGGAGSLADMIAGTERGLLLTTLWYIREVDPAVLLLTGLTRDGVYLVEDGDVSAAVNNFRFNESPLDVLRRATEAGVSEVTLPREWGDWATRAAMPSLRIPDFHMSSVSQAQ
ncbi:metallopeptidase TldD-related protein [Mycolicibacterium holsaticum]|uniref:metallopeptidase TldD-related protein n=1 Tax=Mycolicibacterium holsaticum TaxID=152142 RepID=UPI001C7D70E0|nr:metallopeptidase TldD-related protein [Mycolicibacterium holsaticum]MDA4108105.1 peptidase [Mycolicibacterium holsaticum DSM 44478 = JCM 12374]QZA14480.1 TldD/PmbA family protein [Mycolicibacterium holsaticum DSM 44478 = JCM 12374]UNC08072.1 TldD/PmbA family protein [Mycolicibacterium holsaticum DSM 44478 = JCM 12374]